jgi:hypothetical protein
MNMSWEKTAEYYLNLAKRQGDPYSQRSLLWYSEVCRTRAMCDEAQERRKSHTGAPSHPRKADTQRVSTRDEDS